MENIFLKIMLHNQNFKRKCANCMVSTTALETDLSHINHQVNETTFI